MTNQLEALIADANQSATIMEYLASFEPQDINSDDVELRFELDGVDTGTDVSLVEQCGKASGAIKALIAALEQAQAQSSKWLEAYHKAVSIGARYEERIAEFEASQLAVKLPDSYKPCLQRGGQQSTSYRAMMTHGGDWMHKDTQTTISLDGAFKELTLIGMERNIL